MTDGTNNHSAPLLRARLLDVKAALAQLPTGADVDETVLGNGFLNAPYASFILDWDSAILACNRRAERSFLPVEDTGSLQGQLFGTLTYDDEGEVRHLIRKGAATGVVELPMRAARGSTSHPKSVFRVSLLKSATKGERLILMTQDQLKSTAEALRRMNAKRADLEADLKDARATNTRLYETLISMEAFARAASHDLRTPISTLMGSLQFFATKYADDLPEEALEFLKVMSRATDQMSDMTNELLDHSVSTAQKLSIEQICLRRAIQEVCEDLAPQVVAADAKVEILGEGLFVNADKGLLRMLLSNIMLNALKYRCPSRVPEIHFSFSGAGGENWHLDITDNGRGFDQSDAEKIFLPFHRAHMDVEGTGVGLSTCAEICHRHSWLFTAAAVPDVGATFSISFDHQNLT